MSWDIDLVDESREPVLVGSHNAGGIVICDAHLRPIPDGNHRASLLGVRWSRILIINQILKLQNDGIASLGGKTVVGSDIESLNGKTGEETHAQLYAASERAKGYQP